MGQIEYDTCMPEKVGVRVRRLPDGEFSDALQTSSDGRFLEFELGCGAFSQGSLLEIERGTTVLWGELRTVSGSTARVWIEHSLDRSKLQPILEIWGE